MPQRISKSVPKQVCDDGGNYGAQPQVSQSQGGGGYGGGSAQPQVSQSQGGGYGGGSAPRAKTRTDTGAKLRTGGASSDAVNFGK